MINLQKSIPEVYYNQSRDFQFLARTFEVLFNSVKTNVEVMQGFPFSDNFDIKLLPLLALTLGFTSKHNYNERDLANVCSTFAELLNKKGSIDAIDLAIRTLLNAQQIEDFYDKGSITRDVDDNYNLIITLPYGMRDIVLLEDIFDYILPTGFTYSFKFATRSGDETGANLSMQLESKEISYMDAELGGVASYESERFNFNAPYEDDKVKPLQQVNTGVVVGPQVSNESTQEGE